MPEDIETLKARIAELEAYADGLGEAVTAVVKATRAYLPPDGISAKECISRVLAAVHNPEMYQILVNAETETGAAKDATIASLEQHLGNVLSVFANLDEGDRCRAFEDAKEFYNRNHPDAKIEGEPGFTQHVCLRSPLGLNCRAREVLAVMPPSDSADGFVSAEGPLQSNDGETL